MLSKASSLLVVAGGVRHEPWPRTAACGPDYHWENTNLGQLKSKVMLGAEIVWKTSCFGHFCIKERGCLPFTVDDGSWIPIDAFLPCFSGFFHEWMLGIARVLGFGSLGVGAFRSPQWPLWCHECR